MKDVHGLSLETAHFSLDGGRSYNEDRLDDLEAFGAVRLLALADGAGGQGGGAVASKTAIDAVRAEFTALPVFSPETLLRCMRRAELALRERQSQSAELARMASTFVGLLVNYHRRQALMCNLGDSRCYVFRGQSVHAQSQDHSLVQRFIDAGLYPPGKLREHPKRNVLYASLGANEEGIVPYVSPEPIELRPGDGILLCSDGVWELLDEDVLAQLHAESADVRQWRERLQAAVLQRMPSGHDNSSALLARCLPGAADTQEGAERTTLHPTLPG